MTVSLFVRFRFFVNGTASNTFRGIFTYYVHVFCDFVRFLSDTRIYKLRDSCDILVRIPRELYIGPATLWVQYQGRGHSWYLVDCTNTRGMIQFVSYIHTKRHIKKKTTNLPFILSSCARVGQSNLCETTADAVRRTTFVNMYI